MANVQLKELETKKLATCPCCNSEHISSFVSLHHLIQLNYSICNNCEIVFQNPTLTEASWEKFYQKFYRILYNKSNEPTETVLNKQKQRAEGYLEFFKNNKIAFASHLDIGSSSGVLMQMVRESFSLSYQAGVEPGEKYSEFAEKAGLTIFATIEEAIATGRKFDLITVCHVLEHIPNPVSFLEKIKNLLSDTGYLFIEVPNAEGSIFSMEFAHPLAFTTGSIQFLLHTCGFEMQEIQVHGKPGYIDSRCKKYITLLAIKTNKHAAAFHPQGKLQLQKKMLRNTYWLENNMMYLLKSPARYFKLITGRYAI
jgi:2-polyprenyl-3-methyl-5-hydroxy-6-metoxy-1,4-benzoquinol methylase